MRTVCVVRRRHTAVFFPPSARESVPVLLWTPGLWVDSGDPNATYPHVRPNPALYADGYGQITCLVMARIRAFAMYAAMGNTFLTKCHGLMCALSRTMVAYYFPLERMHKLHRSTGLAFAAAAAIHTVAHLVRYGLRHEWQYLRTTTGVTGILGMLLMALIVAVMYSCAAPPLRTRRPRPVRVRWTARR